MSLVLIRLPLLIAELSGAMPADLQTNLFRHDLAVICCYYQTREELDQSIARIERQVISCGSFYSDQVATERRRIQYFEQLTGTDPRVALRRQTEEELIKRATARRLRTEKTINFLKARLILLRLGRTSVDAINIFTGRSRRDRPVSITP